MHAVAEVSDRRTSMTKVTLEQIMTAARDEHLVPGREVHVQGMRGSRFCEVALLTGADQDNAVANIWNTTGVHDPTPEEADAIDGDTIARENGAVQAWLSPIRHWISDRLDVREAGEDRVFGGITGTWIGVAGAAALMHATVQDSYRAEYVYRNGSVTFDSGNQVYVLDAPDGEVFVMQSVAWHQDVPLGEHDLAHLSRRLRLPAGWGFRAEVLDQDLEVSSNPDNLAHVLQDDLHNVYLGSDVGRAFSLLAPPDSLW
jgi:hypothetical protein